MVADTSKFPNAVVGVKSCKETSMSKPIVDRSKSKSSNFFSFLLSYYQQLHKLASEYHLNAI